MAYKEKHAVLLPDNRLFQPMYSLSIIFDAIAIAMDMMLFGKIRSNMGDFAEAACTQFPLVVRLPLLTPSIAISQNLTCSGIELNIVPSNGSPVLADQAVTGYSKSIIDIVSPIFVNFYEKHYDWMRDNIDKNPYSWPTVLNFSRAVRNFMVHHDGRVNFSSANAAPVSWHNLTYGPSDGGHQAVGSGADLGMADIIVLMVEMADELDLRGCPLNP